MCAVCLYLRGERLCGRYRVLMDLYDCTGPVWLTIIPSASVRACLYIRAYFRDNKKQRHMSHYMPIMHTPAVVFAAVPHCDVFLLGKNPSCSAVCIGPVGERHQISGFCPPQGRARRYAHYNRTPLNMDIAAIHNCVEIKL